MRSPTTPPVIDARVIYVSSRLSLRAVCRQLKGVPGCSWDTLLRRSQKEGWAAERAAFWSGVTDQEATSRATNQPPEPTSVVGSGGTLSPEQLVAAAAIDDLKQEQKVVRDRILRSLQDSYETCVQTVQLYIIDAQAWVTANRSRMVNDGTDDAPDYTVEQSRKTKKIGFAAKSRYMGMLATAASTLRSLMSMDPSTRSAAQELELDKLRGEVEFMRARVAGSLPPERIEIALPSGEALAALQTRAFGSVRFSVSNPSPSVGSPPALPKPSVN